MKKNLFILIIPLLTLISCDDNLQSLQFTPGEEVEFKIGQTISTNNNQISLEIIDINDSRCPSDVQCIWQGEARITFELNNNGKKEFTLTTLELEPDTIDNYIFTLKSVEPYPISTKTLELDDYTVKLKIEEL